ncbi:MAG: nucleotide sugar dehydrogenase [Chloroflexi bacterium]|nr:MAG: nucleotide sugar dehydrogenase [Chloroflexota bacterium]
MQRPLHEKIAARSLRVGVIGLGYVGLPLVATFVEAGFHVTGIDTDQQKVDAANRGESYIPDISSNTLQTLLDTERMYFTTDFTALKNIDAISICVPTPLRKTRDPDISYIISATQQVRAHLHPGQLVVLESTTYPGTTDEVLLPELESTGLNVGVDFFLAFSPERVFYGAAIEQVVPVSSTRVAEMVKLLENTFRAVNIGLVNEIAVICEKLSIDVWEVIDAAATKPFGFMRFLPGPGLGGHCIPIDPHYLSWKLKTLDYTARFIELAAEVNSSMPHYVVNKIGEALNEQRRSFNGATVLVLGVAYKRNVGDVRESPALDIIAKLIARKAQVLYNDEYIPSLALSDRTLYSQPLSNDLLQAADCVVIVTDHSYYDASWIIHEAGCIVDTRNMTHGHNDKKVFRL